MNVTTNEKHLHFINFMKLIEESNMSEVLGSFFADHAALCTVSKNLFTNELSLAFQKDGIPICFLIFTSCFPGGVSATKYKSTSVSALRPGSISRIYWIILAL